MTSAEGMQPKKIWYPAELDKVKPRLSLTTRAVCGQVLYWNKRGVYLIDRQVVANYLNIDRQAVTRALKKLRELDLVRTRGEGKKRERLEYRYNFQWYAKKIRSKRTSSNTDSEGSKNNTNNGCQAKR